MKTTADLFDQYGDRLRVCAPIFRDFGARSACAGRAVTVKCFEDNSRIKEALSGPGEGRVLVVDAGGSLRCAMLGDLIAADAVANGWSGLILNGCVRDAGTLAAMDLGIKALAAIPRKGLRRGEGQRDLPVGFAGIDFSPGDWVYADLDGIVVCEFEL